MKTWRQVLPCQNEQLILKFMEMPDHGGGRLTQLISPNTTAAAAISSSWRTGNTVETVSTHIHHSSGREVMTALIKSSFQYYNTAHSDDESFNIPDTSTPTHTDETPSRLYTLRYWHKAARQCKNVLMKCAVSIICQMTGSSVKISMTKIRDQVEVCTTTPKSRVRGSEWSGIAASGRVTATSCSPIGPCVAL